MTIPWRITLKRLREVKELLNLIQTEFLKLRRKNLIWLMLSVTLVMPFFATLYFRYLGKSNVLPMEFYRWSAFGYTLFIILPFVLGVFCTMLMYNEKQNDIIKQLWIVPVNKIGYFFSKFFVMMYSILFMLINAVASALFSVFSGCVVFSWGSILSLLEKCLEVGLLTSFAMLPVLSIATMAKGYILPICNFDLRFSWIYLNGNKRIFTPINQCRRYHYEKWRYARCNIHTGN